MIYQILSLIALFVLIIYLTNLKTTSKKYKKNTNSKSKKEQYYVPTKDNISDEKEIKNVNNIFPYQKKYLLTKNEWYFYKKIKPICEKYNLHIISKVRLADIVDVKSNLNKSEQQIYFNKIQNKHVDFILCNPENLAIVALIELDDSSHKNQNRIERDEFLNNLCEKVDYKLIRITNMNDFENEIEKIIVNKNWK